jgi:hypothetical protein
MAAACAASAAAFASAAGAVAAQGAGGEGCAPGVVGDVAMGDADAAERGERARVQVAATRGAEARLLPAHGGEHRDVDALGAGGALDDGGAALEGVHLRGGERVEVRPQRGERAGEGSVHSAGSQRWGSGE